MIGLAVLSHASLVPCAALCQIEPNSFGVVKIPGNTAVIADKAFNECTALKSIIWEPPVVVTSIGIQSFLGTSITSIDIPSTVTQIQDGAFGSCHQLTTVKFAVDSQLQIIKQSAFAFCSQLGNIFLPNSVISLYDNAFKGCTSLTAFTTGTGLNYIENSVFNGCTNLNNFDFPLSIKAIRDFAFFGCSRLTKVLFECDAVTQINANAFQGSGVANTGLAIGPYVTYAGPHIAKEGCTAPPAPAAAAKGNGKESVGLIVGKSTGRACEKYERLLEYFITHSNC